MSGTNTHTNEDLSFAELFENTTTHEVEEGKVIRGTVVAVQRDHVIVDIGFKSEGMVRIGEFPVVDGKPQVRAGDEINVLVESKESDSGLCLLSKEKADRMRIWDDIAEAYESETPVEGVITSRVKGGLQVDIGVKAFLPGSQVDLRPIRNLDKLLGERFRFRVIKYNKKRNNIVLSRRIVLEQERDELKKKTLQRLQEGAILDGTVKNITEYGAFIDLGGIDGLLHITDMSWGRLNHPSEMFRVGDEVRVKVLKFDAATERVSLGLKQIQDDPWIDADKHYQVGNRVNGTVVSITDYGAFVELKPGIEGLVHVTEMSWTKRVKHPSKLVAIGDEVEAMVLDIDISSKRISLGMKQCEPNPWTMLTQKYPVGTVIRGPIRNITDFGIFVGIEEGIDGLVHISDLSWSNRFSHPSELYEKGIDVEAVVLNIDVENERFSLGIKQLTDDPWRAMPDHLLVRNRVQGRVIKVAMDHAYVEIEPGIEGRLDAASFGNVADMAQQVRAGDMLNLVIVEVDVDERVLALGK
jgi:small subunit ribosomal protein S1